MPAAKSVEAVSRSVGPGTVKLGRRHRGGIAGVIDRRDQVVVGRIRLQARERHGVLRDETGAAVTVSVPGGRLSSVAVRIAGSVP